MKMLGTINTVIRSVINLIYDLKEFEIRLETYEKVRSEKPEEKEAAELGLKQLWMDQVDLKKGMGSINQMAQQLQFVTLRDAYMKAASLEEAEKMDLNDRVKRILLNKLQEYFKWKEISEKELRNRYEIEKAYLKSQIASLKLYAEWTKPYLIAAKKLEMNISNLSSANIVSVFNNMEIELELSGSKEIKLQSLVDDKDLPEEAKINDKYYQYIVAKFSFRSVPHSVQTPQGYQYRQGGKVTITFRSYGLSETELNEIKKGKEEETYQLIDEMVGTSLQSISDDLERFSAIEKDKKKKEEPYEAGPLSVIFSGFKDMLHPLKGVKLGNESYFDNVVKEKAREKAKGSAFVIYDVYKKAHDMMSF